MTPKRFLLAVAVLFPIAIIWNGFVHLVLLVRLNATVKHLYRTDLADRMWLSLLLTAAVLSLFVWGYTRFVGTSTARQGLLYGVFFALIAGVLVDFNQHVLYPIPARVAGAWFLAGIVEFSVYGLLLTRLLPIGHDRLGDSHRTTSEEHRVA